MKILAFAASNSSTSINKQLVTYAASLVEGAEVEILDINDYEMPIFSIDREKAVGQQPLAKKFLKKIGDADALIISFAEHNGSYSAAYKNLFDWTSRLGVKVYQNKPVLMLAAASGPGGAMRVLTTATSAAPHQSADLRGQLSVPSFAQNFDSQKGQLINTELNAELHKAIANLVE